MTMGHGDLIVLADDNFPSASIANAGPRLIRADGHKATDLLRAIMKFLPLNTIKVLKDPPPVSFMHPVEERDDPPVWAKYREIVNKAEGMKVPVEKLERFAFYDKAKTAYAVVATGEKEAYGNIILAKGIIVS